MRPEAERGLAFCICPLSLLIGRFSERPAAVQGAVCAGRRRIFCGFEKILRDEPWTARTVLKRGTEGKGGRRLIPSEDAGVYITADPTRCPVRVNYH